MLVEVPYNAFFMTISVSRIFPYISNVNVAAISMLAPIDTSYLRNLRRRVSPIWPDVVCNVTSLLVLRFRKQMSSNNPGGSSRMDRTFAWFFVQIAICVFALVYYRQKAARLVYIDNLISRGLLQRLQSDRTLLSQRYIDTALHPSFKVNLSRFKARCLSFSKHCVVSIIFAIIYALVSLLSEREDGPLSEGVYVVTLISILINIISFIMAFFSFGREKNTIKEIQRKINPEILNTPKQVSLPVTYVQPMYANHPQYAQEYQPQGQPAYPVAMPALFVSPITPAFDDNVPIAYYPQSPGAQTPNQFQHNQAQKQYLNQQHGLQFSNQVHAEPSAPYIPPEHFFVEAEARAAQPQVQQQIRKSQVVRFETSSPQQGLLQVQPSAPYIPPQGRSSVVPGGRKSAVSPDGKSNPFKAKKHERSQSNLGLDPNNQDISPRVGTYKFQEKDLIDRGVFVKNENYLPG